MTTAALLAARPNDQLLAGPLGSFEAYAERISRIPVLTREQEVALFARLQQHNDLTAARELVLSHLRFVLHIARGYVGYGLPLGDLVQEGNVGLMKAVKRFDPTQGVRLVSYALHWIKAEIHDFILKNWQMVKVATTKAQRKLFFNLKSLKRALGAERGVTMEQARSIAQSLSVSPEDVLEMDRRLAGGDTPLETRPDDNDEAIGPIATLAAEHADPSELVEAAQETALAQSSVRQALAGLDERSRAIVMARWMSDDETKGPTLHDLANEFGVSAERIRQIESAALKKIKASLS
jgi:RNA polymerase sigma-32 factor